MVVSYALKDIQETLAIWRDEKEWNDPYIVKLYSEFDKLIVNCKLYDFVAINKSGIKLASAALIH